MYVFVCLCKLHTSPQSIGAGPTNNRVKESQIVNSFALYRLPMCCICVSVYVATRKRATAKALQLKGHSDFEPVDLAYYQHFLGLLFENIAFWEVPRGNHKCRSRDATPLVNNKLERVQLQKHCISNAEGHCARRSGFFGLVWFENIVFGRFAKCA